MIKTMANPASLWLMRKQFAQQTASSMFLTYVACLSNRTPSRFHISRKTGLMYMSEVLPGECPQSRERLTDVLQRLPLVNLC